jgi:hypothetical protein
MPLQVRRSQRLTGCRFTESDILKIADIFEAIFVDRRAALISRLEELNAPMTLNNGESSGTEPHGKPQRKLAQPATEPTEDHRQRQREDWDKRQRASDIEIAQRKLDRYAPEYSMETIWKETYTGQNLNEILEYVARSEIVSLEISTRDPDSGLRLNLTIDLESGSPFTNRLIAEGSPDTVRDPQGRITELITRRRSAARAFFGHSLVQSVAGFFAAISIALVIASDLHSAGSLVVLSAFFGSMSVLFFFWLLWGIDAVGPALCSTVAVEGWGRFDSRRRRVWTMVGGLTLAVVGNVLTLIFLSALHL